MDHTLSNHQPPLKFWQKSNFRIAFLLLILTSLLALYFWKTTQLKSNSETSKTSNFNHYLTTLTQKLKSNPEPVSTTAPLKTPTPLPTPKPLPHGIQIYNFSHGKDVVGPKPTKVVINPLDPQLNEYQKIAITIKHSQPVTQAEIVLITDNFSKTIPLSLQSGTRLEGIWSAKYKITHTYNQNYQIRLIFSDGSQTFSGGLTFR